MRRVALVLLVVLAVAAGARAGISVASLGTLTTDTVAPPVSFELGATGSETRFFSPFSLSSNATIASGTILARAGADWTAKDVLRIVNARASAQVVTLSATQLSNAQLDLFRWHVYDGTTLVGTIDMEAADPSVAFTLPASSTYRLDLRLDLADGAGLHNAPSAMSLSLRVGSGGIALAHTTSAPAISVGTVQVPLRPLIAGSSGGTNSTNATASVNAPTILQNTQNVLYLNNTHATAAWFVKIVNTATGSLTDVSTANIGVNNGTASVDQVKVSGGSVSQVGGSYHRLEPASTNRIYVTSLEGVLFNGATIDLDVYASTTATGDSFLLSKARITLT